MAEGGRYDYDDPDLDYNIDDDDDDDDDDQETNTTRPFQPYSASTPYHGGEQYKMQTMRPEQSGLPSYDESTPSLPELERRYAALREDPRTGIIDTSHIDANINPLSEEDRKKQIERVKRLIKGQYPNAKFDQLVIAFSKKTPMDIVALGPKGGKTKIVLKDGSGLQKSFLNQTFVKKALGPPASEIIEQQSTDINSQKKELDVQNANYRTDQQIFKQIDGEMKDIGKRIDRREAKVSQIKEVEGNEEVKREKQVVINLKKDYEAKQKDREVFRKKLSKIAKEKKVQQQTISERERKRNELEEKFYSTKTIDDFKEREIKLQRQTEEDQAIIQNEMATSLEKEAAKEKLAARNEEHARLQTGIAEREAVMPLRERVKEIFKKYGVMVASIFIAAGVTIGAVVGAITNALKAMGKQLANGLKAVGAKAAAALPGLIGAVVSSFSKPPDRQSVIWPSTPGCLFLRRLFSFLKSTSGASALQ